MRNFNNVRVYFLDQQSVNISVIKADEVLTVISSIPLNIGNKDSETRNTQVSTYIEFQSELSSLGKNFVSH